MTGLSETVDIGLPLTWVMLVACGNSVKLISIIVIINSYGDIGVARFRYRQIDMGKVGESIWRLPAAYEFSICVVPSRRNCPVDVL